MSNETINSQRFVHCCDMCDEPAVRTVRPSGDFSHLPPMAACAEHDQYLDGWMRDAEQECGADSAASARYEDAAYGDD